MLFALYILLTLAALMLAAAVSPARRTTLWTALLALGWTVGQLSTLIEAVVFSVMPLGDALLQLGVAAVAMALLVAVAMLLTCKWRGGGSSVVQPNISAATLVTIIVAYQLLYFGAGTLVWPFVADYYSTRALPPFLFVAALQIPRALLFVAAAWPWLRTGPRFAPAVLGTAYAVIGGIAPMFPENPYMPADVRLAHGIETSSSNFLFGLVVAWLMRRETAAPNQQRDREDAGVEARAA